VSQIYYINNDDNDKNHKEMKEQENWNMDNPLRDEAKKKMLI